MIQAHDWELSVSMTALDMLLWFFITMECLSYQLRAYATRQALGPIL